MTASGSRSSAPTRRFLVIFILGIALALRLAYVLQLHGVEPKDPEDYDAYAWNLAQGNGYTNGVTVARRPPLFPFLLAAVYRAAGHEVRAARLLQVALGMALCACVFLLARRLYDSASALLALVVAAGYPYFIYYSGYLMTETLAALLFTWLSLFWLGWDRDSKLAVYFAGGLIAGLAGLARPVFLALPLVVPAWGMSVGLPLRRNLIATILFAAGLVAVVSPWTVRNYLRLGVFAPVQTDSGWQFYQYNLWYADSLFPTFHPEKLGERAGEFRRQHRELFQRFNSMSEAEKDPAALREALAYFAEHPSAYLRAILRKLYWFWRPSDSAVLSAKTVNLGWWFAMMTYAPLLALAAIGWWRLPAQQGWLLCLFVLYLSGMHSLVFQGTPRFRFPLYPHLIAMAAGGFLALAERWRPAARANAA